MYFGVDWELWTNNKKTLTTQFKLVRLSFSLQR